MSANDRRGCQLVKQAAAFVGLSNEEIQARCASAKTITGYDHKRKLRYVKYSSAARCPLLSAVIAAVADMPPPRVIAPGGVYTVGMAAAALDMTRGAVRRLVRSGELRGFVDRGGFLILGADIIAYLGGGAAVLGGDRLGVIHR